MASIAPVLSRIKSQIDALIPESLIVETLESLGFIWRERRLTPVLGVHLLLLQLLAGVSLNALRHLSGIEVSAQAVCKARMRLPLTLLLKLVEVLCRTCRQSDSPESYRGHRVVLADGMSFMVSDTPQLAGHYGRAKNHKGYGQSYPVPKLLALLDASTGMIFRVIALPWARQERACLTRLFAALATGDLILGDRGLVGFTQMALMIKRGLHGLLRLPRDQIVRGQGGAAPTGAAAGPAGSAGAMAARGRRPGWMSRIRFALLPESVELRQIAFRICRPGYRTQWAWLITTLLDPAAHPAQELVTLYARRWQVEVYFRDLKQTLGFKKLRAQTVDGVRKQILGMVILYNLIRSIVRQAANAQGVSPDRVSFKDAIGWLLWSSSTHPTRLKTNPLRVRSTQARLTKGRRRYARLARARASYLKPPAIARL